MRNRSRSDSCNSDDFGYMSEKSKDHELRRSTDSRKARDSPVFDDDLDIVEEVVEEMTIPSLNSHQMHSGQDNSTYALGNVQPESTPVPELNGNNSVLTKNNNYETSSPNKSASQKKKRKSIQEPKLDMRLEEMINPNTKRKRENIEAENFTRAVSSTDIGTRKRNTRASREAEQYISLMRV